MLNEDNDRLPTVCFALLIIYVSIGTCGKAHTGASRRHVQMRSFFEDMLMKLSYSKIPAVSVTCQLGTWVGGGGGILSKVFYG